MKKTIHTAQYPAPTGRLWTARLLYHDPTGPHPNRYAIDYFLPSVSSVSSVVKSPRLRRLLLLPATNESDARAQFDAFLTHHLPALLAPQRLPRDPLLTDLFTWYTHTWQPARGHTPATIAANTVIFKRFTTFCAGLHIHTAADLAAYPSALPEFLNARRQTCKPSTVHRDMVKIKAALANAHHQGIIQTLPIRQWPHIPAPDPDYHLETTPAHLRLLLEHLRTGTHTPGPNTRHYQSALLPIVTFLAATGCRPSDACNLTTDRLQGLDTDTPIALIRQQKTQRLLPIALSPLAVHAIREALNCSIRWGRSPDRAPLTTEGLPARPVFLSARGRALTPGTLYTALRHHCTRLGLPPITPKTFRQLAVTLLYDAGVDPQTVARITGHRSDAIEHYRKLRRGAAHTAATTLATALDLEKHETS